MSERLDICFIYNRRDRFSIRNHFTDVNTGVSEHFVFCGKTDDICMVKSLH
jgi:hypothetical protein